MKNFEKEYKEMIQEEMPDLWGRIEAGLVEKTPIKKAALEWNETFVKEEVWMEQGALRKKAGIDRKGWKYSGLAAACLCGVIVLPAILLTIRDGAFKAAGEVGADFAAGTEAPMEAAAEETTEVTTQVSEGTTRKEATGTVDGVSTETRTEEAAETAGGSGMSAKMQETADTSKAVVQDRDIFTNGTIITDLVVRITEAEPLNYHTIYRAVVERDKNGIFETEEMVEFLAIDSEDTQLKVGESYTVTLEYDGQSEIPLHLQQDDR